MKYVIGIDGGASKTKTLLCDEKLNILAQHIGTGCSYPDLGIDSAVLNMTYGIAPCLNAARLDIGDISCICFGITFLDESKNGSDAVKRELLRRFPETDLVMCNDGVIAACGALCGCAGINVICGTGSAAFGIGENGKSARSGGWHYFFSDEGGGYWIGRRTMELFSKQCDGRAEKGALYDIIYQAFALKSDFDFVDKMLQEVAFDTKSVAKLNELLLAAAKAGDVSAQKIYADAAHELFLMISSVCTQLSLSTPFPVSYTGGVFGCGEYILKPLSEFVRSIGGTLCAPKHEPCIGAVLLAFKQVV